MMPAFRFHILLHTPHAVDLGYSTDSQVGCSRVAPVCWCLLEIVCCRGFTSNLQAVGTLAGLCSVRSLPIWWSAHGQLGGSWAEPTYTLQWRGLRPLGVWLSFPRAVHTLLHRVQSLAGVRSGSGALLNAGNNGRGRHSLNRMYAVEGDGAVPKSGSNVQAHYHGTLLDGSVFDSSRERDEPFEFKLGQQMVIKCWDQAFATMKVGEQARLTCTSDYAYGDRGSPPKIPAKATLRFDVELLGFEADEAEEEELDEHDEL